VRAREATSHQAQIKTLIQPKNNKLHYGVQAV